MPTQLLVNVITVTVPAGAVGYPVPHGLRSNDQAVAPTLILPAAQSVVTVDSADAENVYLSNPSGGDVTVTLRCERGLSNELDAETITPFFQSVGTGFAGVTQVNTGFGLTGGPITGTGTISALAETVVQADAAGIQSGTLTASGAGSAVQLLPVGGPATRIAGRGTVVGLTSDRFTLENIGATTATTQFWFTYTAGGSDWNIWTQNFIIKAGTLLNLPPVFVKLLPFSSDVMTNIRIRLFNAGSNVAYTVEDLRFYVFP